MICGTLEDARAGLAQVNRPGLALGGPACFMRAGYA